jgi:hypothetical protein
MEEPKVTVSETNPGEKPLERAAIAMTPDIKYQVELKMSRDKMIAAIQDSVQIPREDQEMILARINSMDKKIDLLWLTAVCHPHKGGSNIMFTICSL